MNQDHPARSSFWILQILILSSLLVACSKKGDKGDKGDPGDPGTPAIGIDDPLPGLYLQVVRLEGASGAGGRFQVGDTITVVFTVKRADTGQAVAVADLNRGQAMVSGPTFNYQRVIAGQTDFVSKILQRGDGSLSYTFPVPIPETYLAPINNTPNFQHDVLTGQSLLDGTYTVGLETDVQYTIAGDTFTDPANASVDFLLGGASALDKREVVTLANCNNCHESLRIHSGRRTKITNCLLCHTAGSEDNNDPAIEGGSPEITVEFKVMIHKIHSGKNLGSVLGVTTKTDGSRDYLATPKPYRIVGGSGKVHEFSDIQFPVWPGMESPMPRDTGYDVLTTAAKAQEDAMRKGPVSCDSCHGDPDGAGPLPPPEDGALIYSQLTRRSCGSCHDDWVWDRPYSSNASNMPAQSSDSACILCHKVSGDALAVVDAHRHPLVDPAKAPGVRFAITSLVEGGTNNGNGKLDPGEKPQVSFTVKDAQGADVALSSLIRFEAILSGPTKNSNLVHSTSMPNSTLGAGPSYTTFLP